MDAIRLSQVHSHFFVGWLVVLGLVVGSFLNVVIARVPFGESIIRPRSRCPKCGHVLAWFENVPVLSWLLLRGRCRACKAAISARYVAVELVTGLLFWAAWIRFDWTYPLVPALLFVVALVPLVFIDAEHWILPLEIMVPATVLGVLLAVPMGWGAARAAAIGALAAFLAFRALEFFGWIALRKEALGAGDKYLMAMVGAFLTYRSLLAVVLLSSLHALLMAVAMMLITGRAGPLPEGVSEDQEEQPRTMTWAFLRPGLAFWKRPFVFVYSVLLQPIPDEPMDEAGEEVEWVPGKTNLPLGPWIGVAAVEVLLLGEWLAIRVPFLAPALDLGFVLAALTGPGSWTP